MRYNSEQRYIFKLDKSKLLFFCSLKVYTLNRNDNFNNVFEPRWSASSSKARKRQLTIKNTR